MSETETPESRMDSNWQGVAATAAQAWSSDVDETDQEVLRELLVFELDGCAYAIAVERIREIVRMRELTFLPRSPDWILGVVALRGEVVEVVDLGRRLGLVGREPDRTSRIIVLHGDHERVTGILVDSVSEVFRVPEQDIMPAQSLDIGALSEVCRREDEFISILDPELALGFEDD